MRDEGVHPVVVVMAGIGLGALLAGAAALLLRSQGGEVSPEAVRRAARRLRHRAESLAQRVRVQTSRLVEASRDELEEAIQAGQLAAKQRRLELERELRGT